MHLLYFVDLSGKWVCSERQDFHGLEDKSILGLEDKSILGLEGKSILGPEDKSYLGLKPRDFWSPKSFQACVNDKINAWPKKTRAFSLTETQELSGPKIN
jgi:hypothetical protein